MIEHIPGDQADNALEQMLRAELAQGDRIIATARPMLRHLLAHDDHSMFSDAVIARVRGMIGHCARQMLGALAAVIAADGAEALDHEEFVDQHEAQLAAPMLGDADILGHAHALVLEAHLAERLHQRSGIDPALSPLLQELAAAPSADLAQQAMHVLAAQARFMQQQRRMEWPLGEMPGGLFDKAMAALQSSGLASAEMLATAQQHLRQDHDAGRSRIALIARIIGALERKACRALAIDNAGLALFTTALAMAAEQPREVTVLSLGGNQYARLALTLAAAGLDQAEVEKQFLFLHPEIALPAHFASLGADQAARMLAQANLAEAG
jgi:hypothetical protein